MPDLPGLCKPIKRWMGAKLKTCPNPTIDVVRRIAEPVENHQDDFARHRKMRMMTINWRCINWTRLVKPNPSIWLDRAIPGGPSPTIIFII
jgi:hypothetical protein